MDRITIFQLLDKHILLMFSDLYNNKTITSFSVNGDLRPKPKYSYYFKIPHNNVIYDSTNLYSFNYNDETIEYYTCRVHKKAYKISEIKTEEDIHAIIEIFKKEIIWRIEYTYFWHLRSIIESLAKDIPKSNCMSDEVKTLFLDSIHKYSKELVDVINTNVLSNNNESFTESYLSKKTKLTLDYIPKVKKCKNTIPIKTTRKITTNSRIGQPLFRRKLLNHYKSCKICGLDVPKLLTASHIKPWSVSNNFEKLDIDNGFLLCDCHDGTFDNGFITFDDNGNILISKTLDEKRCNLLNINHNIKINVNSNNCRYLKWHREHCFIDNK